MLVLLACQPPPAATAPPITDRPAEAETLAVLDPSAPPFEGKLGAGETRRFVLDPPAGHFVDLRVEQLGVDLVARLLGPDGTLRLQVDSPSGARGAERLAFLVEAAGAHTVELATLEAGGAELPEPGGRFRLEVVAFRPALEGDRRLARAEAHLAEAESARQRGRPGDLPQALEQARAALDLYRELGARDREADALVSLGKLLALQGREAEAGEAFAAAVPRLAAAGRRSELARAQNNLGNALLRSGDLDAATRAYAEALALYRRLGEAVPASRTERNLGLLYRQRGWLEQAHVAFEGALLSARAGRDGGLEAAALADLGRLALSLGQPEEAADALAHAASRARQLGETRQEAIALAGLGAAELRLGRRPAGRAAFARALARARASGDEREEAVIRHNLGLAEQAGGDPAAARRAYREAERRFAALGDRRGEAVAMVNGAGVDLAAGEPARAETAYLVARSTFAAVGDPAGEAAALIGVGRCRRALGDLPAALTAAEEAVARVEALRAAPRGPAARVSLFADRLEAHDLAVEVLLELARARPGQGFDQRAFEMHERTRARGLAEERAEAAAAPRDEEAARALAQLGGLAARRRALAAEAAGAGQPALRAELAARLAELDRLAARRRGPRAPLLPLSIAELQRRGLARGELLLVYRLGEPRSTLWVLSHDRLETFSLAARSELEPAVARALHLLPASHRLSARRAAAAALDELGGLLLGPVAARLPGQRLFVVPDGPLAALPFGALGVVAAGASRPLAALAEPVLVPSASFLARARPGREGRAPGRTLALFADPPFDSAERLPPLPFSRAEAASVAARLPAGEGLFALGEDASLARLRGAPLERYRVLHFATHALVDEELPDLSGIFLAAGPGSAEPGFWTAAEIRHRPLAADLVVLSACRTARGRQARGEGTLGLARAFLAAGARAVLVALWEVEDRATAELMSRFYDQLAGGAAPAAALARAQAALAAEPGSPAPAFWAGFVLVGVADAPVALTKAERVASTGARRR
ncbi:MAG TPA: CHAT domain-containing tetratricopeptide repeat protein [Thermoanaerobaculia bacterium]|nr:CHAT domain-containing tetratricopeptide repeat protein [Thermoanaerobaculia bacterium]